MQQHSAFFLPWKSEENHNVIFFLLSAIKTQPLYQFVTFCSDGVSCVIVKQEWKCLKFPARQEGG